MKKMKCVKKLENVFFFFVRRFPSKKKRKNHAAAISDRGALRLRSAHPGRCFGDVGRVEHGRLDAPSGWRGRGADGERERKKGEK